MKGAKNVEMEAEWELFDRREDPQQMRNVYGEAPYAITVRELRTELERLRRELGDER